MPTQINFTITDEKGLNSTVSIDTPDGLTLAQYGAYADAVAPYIDGITAGQILSAKMSVGLTLAGAPFGAALEGADVEEKALFVFRSANGYLKRVTIPAVNEAVVQTSGALNEADANVAGFITMLQTGDGVVAPTDYRGDDLVSLVEARKYFGRDRGG